ncbi:MAG: hypothetical protein U1E97_09790 [Alphaproteobacteria bacterium]
MLMPVKPRLLARFLAGLVIYWTWNNLLSIPPAMGHRGAPAET